MLNHSSATPHTIKSTNNRKLIGSAKERKEIPHKTKNKTLKVNGNTPGREETAHLNKSATNKRPYLNGRSKKTNKKSVPGALTTDKKSVPGAVATGYQGAKKILNGTSKTRISNGVKRRAQAIINDRSIDPQSRAIIRYGLEINDPWLPELVRRIDAGETIFETIVVLKHPKLTATVRTGTRSKR